LQLVELKICIVEESARKPSSVRGKWRLSKASDPEDRNARAFQILPDGINGGWWHE
jgi:hypothetical protein